MTYCGSPRATQKHNNCWLLKDEGERHDWAVIGREENESRQTWRLEVGESQREGVETMTRRLGTEKEKGRDSVNWEKQRIKADEKGKTVQERRGGWRRKEAFRREWLEGPKRSQEEWEGQTEPTDSRRQ